MEINGPSGPIGIALAVILGLGTMGYGAYSYSAQSSALDSAETVDATVSSVSVERDSAGKGVDYTPKATFNYTYEGETYTSSNVYPGKLPREFGSEEKARSQLDGYESGSTVTAYVPQDSPGNAYLKQESSNKPLLVIGLGALLALGGVRSALTG
jgi:hypothetical protein